MDIFNKARNEIIIIDNYAGKELLDILKDINKKIIIVTPNIDEKLKEKYESQYNNVTFIHNEDFHDRFIILDRYRLFSCGSSLKDVGKKCFAINEFDNPLYVDKILEVIKKTRNWSEPHFGHFKKRLVLYKIEPQERRFYFYV